MLKQAIKRLNQMRMPQAASEGQLDLERQIGRVKTEIKRRNVPATADRAVQAIADAIESYEQAKNDPTTIEGGAIEIKTALFRFDTRSVPPPPISDADEVVADDVTVGQHNEGYTPPLSWLLSQTDLKAIEVAWQKYRLALDTKRGPTVATAAHEAGSPDQPWQGSKSIAENTIQPRELSELFQ